MSSPIGAILWDVGGVLVRTFDQSGRQAWEQRLGLPPGGAEAVVLNSEMGHRAQRGEIGDETLWAWVGERLALGDELQHSAATSGAATAWMGHSWRSSGSRARIIRWPSSAMPPTPCGRLCRAMAYWTSST